MRQTKPTAEAVEKLLVSELKRLGLIEDILPDMPFQQARKYLAQQWFHLHTSEGDRVGVHGTTFRIINIGWSCRTIEQGIELWLEIDCREFDELRPIAKHPTQWRARYRSPTASSKDCMVHFAAR